MNSRTIRAGLHFVCIMNYVTKIKICCHQQTNYFFFFYYHYYYFRCFLLCLEAHFQQLKKKRGKKDKITRLKSQNYGIKNSKLQEKVMTMR